MKAFVGILLGGAMVASCSTQADDASGTQNEVEQTVTTRLDPEPITAGVKAKSITAYVAQAPSQGQGQGSMSMAAQTHGKFEVRNGCLAFDFGGNEPYTPVFGQGVEVRLSDRGMVSPNVSVSFDKNYYMGGGEMPPGSASMLIEPLPKRCSSNLWQVSGITEDVDSGAGNISAPKGIPRPALREGSSLKKD